MKYKLTTGLELANAKAMAAAGFTKGEIAAKLKTTKRRVSYWQTQYGLVITAREPAGTGLRVGDHVYTLAERVAIRFHASEGLSIGRTAKFLGLSRGALGAWASRNGIKFSGERGAPYGNTNGKGRPNA